MRIVCFHLNQVGDLAFALPALKCIRESYPEAFITSVARPSAVELLTATGLVDEVLPRSSRLDAAKLKLAGRLARGRYDTAVVFSQSAECAMLAYVTRARNRAGFINTSLGSLLTLRVDFHHPPSTENNLRLVDAVGCRITSRDYSGLLRPTAVQNESAERLLSARGVGAEDRIVAFAPGTSGRRSVKEWTDEGFAEVGQWLADRGFRAVILGMVPADGIVGGCSSAVDLSGATSLGEAAGILARCEALVSVDSGILHIAAAVGTPVVGLYGPSNPAITGPQGEGHVVVTSGADCSPCVKTECKYQRKCMANLNAGLVVQALEQVLSRERTQ